MRQGGTLAPQVRSRMQSPVGMLTLVGTDAGLSAVLWERERAGRVPLRVVEDCDAHPVLVEARQQLEDYFAGRRRTFDLPLDVHGTSFQRDVWRALATIPFGERRSYAELARQIGRARAVRAVGAANGRNPLSIVTPCHRVVGSNGALTGFAGGLDVKARLLAFESGGRL